ncbi:4Fe-4S cluster-binding domain-containing protein [Marinitoga sp. 1155]|uniref:4Fe-4S cluster-binding domain-containing protein n=1 Tax=Marinitoga sp. 1155 TaxID=1428448 RepID=UPI000A49B4BD|nr:4Fe-4S cluster-binding domain-containing protein [Marinitoga sp. 1155]
MNLIHYPILTLGPSKRLGIWFQGCSIRCNKCISKHTWEFEEDKFIDWIKFKNIIKSYSKNGRVTISGGEPFDQPDSLNIMLDILREAGYYDILIYTGYRYEYIYNNYKYIINKIDVLIDGSFIYGNQSESIWKGSENQNMYILTKNNELKKIYEEYKKIKKNKNLQLLNDGKNFYLIGIPYHDFIDGID